MGNETDLGIIEKYTVKRNNDPNGKHDECWYFVLDPKHDPIAQKALLEYANEAERQGFKQLREDIYMKVMLIQQDNRQNK